MLFVVCCLCVLGNCLRACCVPCGLRLSLRNGHHVCSVIIMICMYDNCVTVCCVPCGV